MGEENYVTRFLNEMLTLLAARCATRSAALREQAGPVMGRLHLDHGLTAKADKMDALRDQFIELSTTGDSAELLASITGEFGPMLGLDEDDAPSGPAMQATGPDDTRPGFVHYQPYPEMLPFTIVPPPGEAAAPEAPAA